MEIDEIEQEDDDSPPVSFFQAQEHVAALQKYAKTSNSQPLQSFMEKLDRLVHREHAISDRAARTKQSNLLDYMMNFKE